MGGGSSLVRAVRPERLHETICRHFGEILCEYLPERAQYLFTLGLIRAEHVVQLAVWPAHAERFPRLRGVMTPCYGAPPDFAHLPHLEHLRLDVRVKDASILRPLVTLHSLEMRFRPESLEPLAALPRLRQLRLWQGGELSQLSGLTQLERLEIDRCGSAIGPIRKLTRLTWLDLGIYKGDLHSVSYLTSLRVLMLPRFQDGGIRHLGALTGLEKLSLDDLNGDIAPLMTLVMLRELYLNSYAGATIAPLAPMRRIRVLHLGQFSGDLTPLADKTQLRELHLHNQTGSIEPLEKLVRIRILSLSRYNGTITVLANLISLRSLYLNSFIGELRPLSSLTQLRMLVLRKIRDSIAALAPLPNLEMLNISRYVGDLSMLRNFTKLRRLTIARSNSIPDWLPPSVSVFDEHGAFFPSRFLVSPIRESADQD